MSILRTIAGTVSSSALDKPVYKIVGDRTDGVEERVYEATKWVSTAVEGVDHEEARSTGFQRLFKYITGTNDKGQKVNMTSPVATKIEHGEGPNCANKFTVSFYVPPENQEDPPKPTNPDVFIEQWPEMTVLVKSFSGFAKEKDWLEQAETLTNIVNKSGDSDKVAKNLWFTAGYNSPFQLFGRTNEVWFVKDVKEGKE